MDVCNAWWKRCLEDVKWKFILRNIWNKLDEEWIVSQSTIWTKVIWRLSGEEKWAGQSTAKDTTETKGIQVIFYICTRSLHQFKCGKQRSSFSLCIPMILLGSSLVALSIPYHTLPYLLYIHEQSVSSSPMWLKSIQIWRDGDWNQPKVNPATF